MWSTCMHQLVPKTVYFERDLEEFLVFTKRKTGNQGNIKNNVILWKT